LEDTLAPCGAQPHSLLLQLELGDLLLVEDLKDLP
jgi:hypothetical protein